MSFRRYPLGVGASPLAYDTPRTVLAAILSLLLPIVGRAAEPEPVPIDEGQRSLWVQLCDCVQLDSETLEGLMDEVTSIYSKAGVRIRWKRSCSAPTIETQFPGAARVYIVSQLPGAVRIRFHHQLKSSNLMAYTFTDPGGIPGAVIHVAIESVEAKTRLSGAKLTPELRSRALGRVVAHELAHRFLRSRHTPEGLLKDTFDRHDLIDEGRLKPYFTAEQAKLLQAVAQQNNRTTVETVDLEEDSKAGLANPRQ